MDLALILTYRCNSRCSMCHVWQNPTSPEHEIGLDALDKIPFGIDYLNLTGGEPTLRKDLAEICDVLYPKAMTLEISSNGTYPERLEPIIRKYPDIKIRFSLDGIRETNDRIRGEKNGYERKVRGLLRLKGLGGCDLGFAVTIQDDNAHELVELFNLTQRHGLELATSSLHNGFQFHKGDNIPRDRRQVAHQIEGLITEMLRTQDVKNWFRAFLNLGLMRKVLGQRRLLPCTAARDFVFIDPWSDVYACNVRPDLKLGNLVRQPWQEIVEGSAAQEIRSNVRHCDQNCWMVGSAKTAMRNPRYPRLPRSAPLRWVLANKARVTLGMKIPFEQYVDYSGSLFEAASHTQEVTPQPKAAKRTLHASDAPHYERFGEFFNT